MKRISIRIRGLIIRRYAQSISEFSLLLILVAAALIAMQVYIKRSLQGRIKDLASQIAPSAAGDAQQYEPGTTESDYITYQNVSVTQTYNQGITRIVQNESINRYGNETTYPQER